MKLTVILEGREELRLDELAVDLHATKAQIVRSAILFYSQVHSRLGNDLSLRIVDPTGKQPDLEILFPS